MVSGEVQIRSKELKYRGKSLEELQALGVREVAKFLPARSRRTVLRNFNDIEKFIKKCNDLDERKKKIKTHLRDLIIVPKFVGKTIWVYNGRDFLPVEITIDMIGHRLGEFSFTRKRAVHTSAGIGATKGSRAKKK